MGGVSTRLKEIYIGLMAALSITVVIIISLFPLPPGWLFTLYTADLVVCLVFAWEFFFRLLKSPRKSEFLKYQSYEMLALVPAVAFFNLAPISMIAALLRAVRLIRVTIIVHGSNPAMQKSRLFQLALKTIRML